jgi:hypothetical protein
MELVLAWITTLLLTYQVTVMPEAQNAKYTFSLDSQDRIIRMNTQDGSMHYCKTVNNCETKDTAEPIVTNQ